MFYKINKMENPIETVVLNEQTCEDFQGYPVSPAALDFMTLVNSVSSQLSSQTIYLYKLDYLFSQKNYQLFTAQHTATNTIRSVTVPVQAFWERLELTDTSKLTNQLLTSLTRPDHVQ